MIYNDNCARSAKNFWHSIVILDHLRASRVKIFLKKGEKRSFQVKKGKKRSGVKKKEKKRKKGEKRNPGHPDSTRILIKFFFRINYEFFRKFWSFF